jgi:hypothetical protein
MTLTSADLANLAKDIHAAVARGDRGDHLLFLAIRLERERCAGLARDVLARMCQRTSCRNDLEAALAKMEAPDA